MKPPVNSRNKAAGSGGKPGKLPAQPDEPWPAETGGFLQALGIRDWLLGLLLMAATLAAYRPCLTGQFVWDDDSWTTILFPRLSGFPGLFAIWSHPTALQQYYPLTATSFWLDYHLWGFWTVPYHFENILLHGFAAVLLWRLLRRLQMPGAFFAGAIFAFHPVNVESAAWITERKNVLSLVFYLAAIFVYGHFAGFWREDRPNAPRRNRAAYALALLLALCALLAKTTALSLPAVLLLICWWKRGQIRWRADALPTLPFFGLALGMCTLTAWLEKHHVMAQGADWNLTLGQRCLIAGRALWFYAGNFFCPAHLCFVYPRWEPDVHSPAQWLWPVTAAGVLLALWLMRGRIGRGPATAAFFFAGTLFPLLGFFNSYFMRYSFVCDHWAYLSGPGLIALVAALATRAAQRLRSPSLLQGFAAAVLSILAVLTWRQSAMYLNAETLYRTTLAQNPKSDLARQNLGQLLLAGGRVDDAVAQFRIGLAFQPDRPLPYNNLGNALLRQGRPDEAIPLLQKALQLDPSYASACFNLGDALRREGRMDEAIALMKKGLELQPDYPGGFDYLGTMYLQLGRLDDAVAQLKKAVELKPDLVHARDNLAEALIQQGRPAEAAVQLRQALELQPNNADTMNKLAWVLATSSESSVRNGPRAVELALQANQLTGGTEPAFIATLAAAYAETGRFPQALATAQRALDLALSQSDTKLAQTLRDQISLYQAGSPYRAPLPNPPPH